MKGKLIAFSLIIITFFWYNQLIINLTKPTLIKLKIVPNISANQIPINKFSYPKLGILTPFSISPQTSPLLNSSWSAILPELKNGVSIAFETEKFNESTIIYITGHSSDNFPHAYSSVFAPLVSAKNGDLFSLNIDHQIITYNVVEIKVLDPADIDGLNNLKPKSNIFQRAVLVTCYPLLTSQKRLVVVGEKINL